MVRDLEDEKNGESSKKVTVAERKYDECQGNNNNSPSEVESIPRSTTKDMRRKEMKRLGRKKNGMRDLVM